jgi:hypothetical protein
MIVSTALADHRWDQGVEMVAEPPSDDVVYTRRNDGQHDFQPEL